MSSETPDDWRPVRLGDLLAVEHGYAFKSAHFTGPAAGDPIVVGIGNFKYTGGFRFLDTSVKGYAGDYPDRFELAAGDILLVMTCQTQGGEILGIPGRVPGDGRKYLHNQRIGKVRFTSDEIDPDFAYWLFLSPEFNRHLCRTATGSKILHTAPGRIESFTFALPPLDEQRDIARVLSALSDKADSNKRLARLLEDTVRAAFHARFAAAPGEAVARNWALGTLDDLATLAKRSIRPAETPDRLFEHFSIPAFDDGEGPELVAGASMLSAKTLLPETDAVLLSKLNPSTKRVWWPRPSATDIAVCSPEFLVLIPRHNIPASYLFAAVAYDERFYADLLGHVSGTTGSRQRVRPRDALACDVILPDAESLADWDAFARPSYDHAHSLLTENRTLASVHHLLLPRLIAGRLRVPELVQLGQESPVRTLDAIA